MYRTRTMFGAACLLSAIAAGALFADGAKTAARPTAEAWFVELRKAAASKNDAKLTVALPSKLVENWADEKADDGRKWRADLAARLAAGDVVWVRENGDSAVARWKTGSPADVREMLLQFKDGNWAAASPWAWCVGGGDLAKANGRGAAHLKLKVRASDDGYGPSAFSFAHVTQNPAKCLNRMDVWYCRCGKLHAVADGMFSPLSVKTLDEADGVQTGGDWTDEIVPKDGAVYVLSCRRHDHRDFQVVLQVTACSAASVEFDWRLVAAGKSAPAGIRKQQQIVADSTADGSDQMCRK